MLSDVVRDITLREVTPFVGKGALGACRISGRAHDGALNPGIVARCGRVSSW